MRRAATAAVAVLTATGLVSMGPSSGTAAADPSAERASTVGIVSDDPPRVLVWGGTYGFRHPSVTTGETTMLRLAQSSGVFEATVTENPADLSMATLREFDVLMWVSTTGKAPLTEQQREEVAQWSACGGGNLGIHAVADSEYGWAEHTRIFGAQFDSHPHGAQAPAARVVVESPADPTVAGWASSRSFQLADEYYRWRGARGVAGISLPRDHAGTEVLLSLDETTVAEGIQQGAQPYEDNQPIAWKRTYGQGRVFYNNMGHNESTWSQPAYEQSLLSAVSWVSGVRPDPACLDAEPALPRPARPPAPDRATIGQRCEVPTVTSTNESSPPRRVTRVDTQALGGGVPGNLGWGGQTWVVDLSRTRAARARVEVELAWSLPTDDYDLSITTAWDFYGADDPVGGTGESVTLRRVPHCAVLQVAGDNMLAASRAGTTASIRVVPRR